jgi:Rad3-related DNA helicase
MRGYRTLCRDTLQTDGDGIERGYDLNHGAMESFHTAVRKLRPVVDTWLRTHQGEMGESEVWTLSGALRRVETIAEIYDKTHVTFVEVEGEDLTVRLICLDPSQALDERLQKLHGCVFFSATMVPMSYYADVLGGGKGGSSKHSTILHLRSPFDPENFALCTVNTISTKLEDRPRSYKKLVDVIAATASAKPGNYIVYFPSYDYMSKVQELFSKKYPKVTTVVQKRGMTAPEREQFLEAFRDDTNLRIGFCVLGGSFSEGVDLPGRKLIGAIVVGTGLPGISNEGNILSEYYENTRGSGFDYAYRYPGYSRVLQAAGRVIRRDDDRGVVVLVDDSWGAEKGNDEWDAHWSKPATIARSAAELAEILRIFWKNLK